MLTADQFETVLQFANRVAARMDPQSRVAIETLCAAIEAQAIPRPYKHEKRPENANSWAAVETLETIAERTADPATRSGACLLLLLISGANYLSTESFALVGRDVLAPAAPRRNRRVARVHTAAEFLNTIAHNDASGDDSGDDSGEA
ncbi:hypothetical protein KGQ64_18805 [bacterium]|nr:hypothetical protein [bacterium]